MDKQLTWREIKGLYQLYVERSTKAKIETHPYIKHLIDRRFIDWKRGSKKILVPTYKFNPEIEKEGIDSLYHKYLVFLTENDLLSDHTQFSEFEIKCMMTLKNSPSIMEEMRNKIVKGEESRKGISNKFFKSAKHIKKDSALEKAILKILNVEEFPQNDNQGYYRVPCKNPKCIILCENMYFLTLTIAPENDVELWCVGGNNTKPLERIPKIDYPIFYLCDWDYDGLKIYERIHGIIEQNENRKTSIKLITPNGKKESVLKTEDHHRSNWRGNYILTENNALLYTFEQINLINNLVAKNEWIEEESNNLLEIITKI